MDFLFGVSKCSVPNNMLFETVPSPGAQCIAIGDLFQYRIQDSYSCSGDASDFGVLVFS